MTEEETLSKLIRHELPIDKISEEEWEILERYGIARASEHQK